VAGRKAIWKESNIDDMIMIDIYNSQWWTFCKETDLHTR
jgi:hypothetical protein